MLCYKVTQRGDGSLGGLRSVNEDWFISQCSHLLKVSLDFAALLFEGKIQNRTWGRSPIKKAFATRDCQRQASRQGRFAGLRLACEQRKPTSRETVFEHP